MKLSVKIPLLLGIVVFVSTAAMLVVVELKVRSTIEQSALNSLVVETEENADFLKSKLDLHIEVLAEIANRIRVRSMDWSIVQPALKADVARIGALDLAMIDSGGVARYVLSDTTINVRDRTYFHKAMAGEKSVEMVVSRVTGKVVTVFAVPIRKTEDMSSPVVGVLLARKDGAQTLSNLVEELKTPYESGYAYLINEQGTMIAHRNQELINKQFNPVIEAVKDTSLKSFAGMVAAAFKEKRGRTEYNYDGKNLIGAFSKVPGFNWILFLSIEKYEIENKLSEISITIVLISFICLIAGVIAAIGVGRSIAKPVIRIVETSKNITQGEGDLTQSIPVNFEGEMGDLARYFNKLIATLRVPISDAKVTVDNLSTVSEELSSINRQLEIDQTQTRKEYSQEILRISQCIHELAATAGQLRQTMDKFKV
ncbi:MAG: methyl-accepting chemotaxis protein [Fibromonadaceae bacterium]|jgi:methyl-accepting chemotaxis protein|nr:methyl-accepting chemotaxis protein [Fibromonadaceae bacterium]